ncbi:MAG: hypothetical protein Kapaf2KO_21330 [Candidatus Kapaibacteriales bacterium]
MIEKKDEIELCERIGGIEIPKHLRRTKTRTEKIYEVALKRQHDITIVLENVHDVHNISACLRSADATGLSTVHVVNSILPSPFRKIGTKTSAGTKKWVETVKWKSIEECYRKLKEEGFAIYATYLGEENNSLHEIDFTKKTAIVFGNEHSGVSDLARELSDGTMIIPQVGMSESLNISVACAVTLYEAYRQKDKVRAYSAGKMSESNKELFFKMLDK